MQGIVTVSPKEQLRHRIYDFRPYRCSSTLKMHKPELIFVTPFAAAPVYRSSDGSCFRIGPAVIYANAKKGVDLDRFRYWQDR